MNFSKIKLIRILQLSATTVFLGRAWQYLYWDAPFRALLWDESLMQQPIEKLFGWSWERYVSSPEVEAAIQYLINGVGVLYLFAALAVYLSPKFPRLSKGLLFLGGINLIILAILETKTHFFFASQFFEYSLQFSVPFFLLIYWKHRQWNTALLNGMKVAIALVFISHGLFAIGFYPRPGYFVEMVMNVVGLNQRQAIQFLNIAGILDFVVSIAIFLPHRLAKPALFYMVFWGFCTTMARIAANFYPELWQYTLSRWVHESLFRFPHFLIPLLVLIWAEKQNKL